MSSGGYEPWQVGAKITRQEGHENTFHLGSRVQRIPEAETQQRGQKIRQLPRDLEASFP